MVVFKILGIIFIGFVILKDLSRLVFLKLGYIVDLILVFILKWCVLNFFVVGCFFLFGICFVYFLCSFLKCLEEIGWNINGIGLFWLFK